MFLRILAYSAKNEAEVEAASSRAEKSFQESWTEAVQ
jgi:hypothetical protein